MGLFDVFRRKNDVQEDILYADQSQLINKKEKKLYKGLKTFGENAFETNSSLFNQYRIYRQDSILKQTVAMYVELCVNNGFDVHSSDEQINKKIKQRIKEIEFNSNSTMYELVRNGLKNFISLGNQMFLFSRNANNASGKPYMYNNKQLNPISGIFQAHPLTLSIKRNSFGETTQYKMDLSMLQRDFGFFTNDPEFNVLVGDTFGLTDTRKFDKYDVAHFKFDEDIITGFGRPFYFEAIDDLLILRKIERIIEELISEGKLFYVLYRVGNDKHPSRSQKEIDQMKQLIDSVSPYQAIVQPHNHSMEMHTANILGNILGFYDKIRHRVYGALGLSSVMMGEAGQANRATAETSTNFAIIKAKEFQNLFSQQFQHEVLEHLVIDLGYNPKQLGDAMPKLKFNEPDIDTLIKYQNQIVYMYEHSAITQTEMRQKLGFNPKIDEKDMYIYKVKIPAQIAGKSFDNTAETNNKVKPQNQHTK